MHLKLGIPFALAGVLSLGGAALAHEHEACDPDAPLQPLQTVADVDGDGYVTDADVEIVKQAKKDKVYIALFDRNADERLTGADVALTKADRDAGAVSTVLDQEIASVYWATEHLRDQGAAIAQGYMPLTQEAIGHGEHWAYNFLLGHFGDEARMNYDVQLEDPEGLNYTPAGELVAVFYYHGAGFTGSAADGTLAEDPFNPYAMAPEGFTGDHDGWHHHIGACLGGVDYLDPTYDASELSFTECVPAWECPAGTRWNPKFHMLHLWLYKLNPCGKFAGHHPALTTGQDPHDANQSPTGSCTLADVLPPA